MRGDLVVLVNPAARGGRAGRVAGPVVRRLREGGRDVRVIVGASAEDALHRARTAVALGADALVAVGGDGLVHLAVQAVAGTGVPLGIVPAGTGNDIADALGVPRDPLAAAAVAVGDESSGTVIRAVDAARIAGEGGDRWFAGVVACGFDSRVNERANGITWPPGMAKYLVALVQELRAFTPIPFRIVLEREGDTEVVEREAMLVAVANTRSYGAGMRVCPDARPDDGLLDVLVLGAVPKGEFLRTFPKVYRGGHVGHPAVTIRRAARVTLEAADQGAGVVAYADGERVGPVPVTCSVEPGALRVLLPG
ncbi:diacylglycerol kinase family protein [Microtetraspora niveoalba]|uniref:diacylglycerol kinase family protein n=1 Tax=Microtetraspora niveoalba TaxID=46175 RepID=UPI000834DE4C|nr:diacylglycerol kinase family protein [Microtetraspora niveoalba]